MNNKLDNQRSKQIIYILLLLVAVIWYACSQRAVIDHFGQFQAQKQSELRFGEI